MSLQMSRFKHLTLPQNLEQESSAIKMELTKIDCLQEKIKNIQLQLAQLKKQDKSCDKTNLSEINTTLFAIRNKINISQTHQKVIKRKKQHQKTYQIQKNKVQELRTKQIQELERARQQNKKMKEDAMKQIKQMSLLNNKIINDQKQNLLQKNHFRAQKIKQDKQNAKKQTKQLRLNQMLQKHKTQMEKSRSRLAQQKQLLQKYSVLTKNKQDLQEKVSIKKQYTRKLHKIYQDIGKMNDSQIQKTMLQIKNKIKDKQMNEQKADEQQLKLKMFQQYLIQAEEKTRDNQKHAE